MNYNLIKKICVNNEGLYFFESLLNLIYRIIYLFFLPYLKSNQLRKKYYFAICAIFKNEAKFMKEWLDYYYILGVDHIYMYNNNSDDNYLDVLKPYIDTGYVTLMDWPYKYGQMEAYADCYNRFKEETNWLSFIDLDEFICPLEEYDIKDFLVKYEGYPSLMVFWKMFGTNGQLSMDDSKLVVEQFTCGWRDLDSIGKVIFSTSNKFEPTRIYNHSMNFIVKLWKIKLKVPSISERKRFLFFYINNRCSKRYTIQINHYFSKDYNSFLSKISKGSAATKNNNLIREKKDFFYSHEKRNMIEDKSIFRFLIKLKLKYYGLD